MFPRHDEIKVASNCGAQHPQDFYNIVAFCLLRLFLCSFKANDHLVSASRLRQSPGLDLVAR